MPFFVDWIDGEPDFRLFSSDAFRRCVRNRLCWICGEPLGAIATFVIGPMCAVNRTSSEPPSHTDCAEYSARVCPFLTTPSMRRRETGIPEDAAPAGGVMLKRNPGVALCWSTRNHVLYRDHVNGGALFEIGDPIEVSWWAHGREATRDEVHASITSGLPALEEVAEQQGRAAQAELARRVDTAMQLLPDLVGAPSFKAQP